MSDAHQAWGDTVPDDDDHHSLFSDDGGDSLFGENDQDDSPSAEHAAVGTQYQGVSEEDKQLALEMEAFFAGDSSPEDTAVLNTEAEGFSEQDKQVTPQVEVSLKGDSHPTERAVIDTGAVSSTWGDLQQACEIEASLDGDSLFGEPTEIVSAWNEDCSEEERQASIDEAERIVREMSAEGLSPSLQYPEFDHVDFTPPPSPSLWNKPKIARQGESWPQSRDPTDSDGFAQFVSMDQADQVVPGANQPVDPQSDRSGVTGAQAGTPAPFTTLTPASSTAFTAMDMPDSDTTLDPDIWADSVDFDFFANLKEFDYTVADDRRTVDSQNGGFQFSTFTPSSSAPSSAKETSVSTATLLSAPSVNTSPNDYDGDVDSCSHNPQSQRKSAICVDLTDDDDDEASPLPSGNTSQLRQDAPLFPLSNAACGQRLQQPMYQDLPADQLVSDQELNDFFSSYNPQGSLGLHNALGLDFGEQHHSSSYTSKMQPGEGGQQNQGKTVRVPAVHQRATSSSQNQVGFSGQESMGRSASSAGLRQGYSSPINNLGKSPATAAAASHMYQTSSSARSVTPRIPTGNRASLLFNIGQDSEYKNRVEQERQRALARESSKARSTQSLSPSTPLMYQQQQRQAMNLAAVKQGVAQKQAMAYQQKPQQPERTFMNAGSFHNMLQQGVSPISPVTYQQQKRRPITPDASRQHLMQGVASSQTSMQRSSSDPRVSVQNGGPHSRVDSLVQDRRMNGRTPSQGVSNNHGQYQNVQGAQRPQARSASFANAQGLAVSPQFQQSASATRVSPYQSGQNRDRSAIPNHQNRANMDSLCQLISSYDSGGSPQAGIEPYESPYQQGSRMNGSSGSQMGMGYAPQTVSPTAAPKKTMPRKRNSPASKQALQVESASVGLQSVMGHARTTTQTANNQGTGSSISIPSNFQPFFVPPQAKNEQQEILYQMYHAIAYLPQDNPLVLNGGGSLWQQCEPSKRELAGRSFSNPPSVVHFADSTLNLSFRIPAQSETVTWLCRTRMSAPGYFSNDSAYRQQSKALGGTGPGAQWVYSADFCVNLKDSFHVVECFVFPAVGGAKPSWEDCRKALMYRIHRIAVSGWDNLCEGAPQHRFATVCEPAMPTIPTMHGSYGGQKRRVSSEQDQEAGASRPAKRPALGGFF